ncbi:MULTISPECIES: hypothetical protein [Kitasatospora]|uniref:Uncharacterized protein n=1 Tax=Kitasatospora setae (strain ATCC 33774 / DSM 43861 / JCM 3304 / KCC A-0304 / NBRC 14216 / KM-6054) TaxID=452652 RepID=E4N8A6_KITSK|nr:MULTISPECIES: hypothetical protein [Kitasatospora]BAJ27437.1 hypothetical protein KSE_16120 [Kitasatospora setae KM-6054]
MTNDVEKAAEKARCAERAAEYDREFVKSWQQQADGHSTRGHELHAEFLELLSAEPWFRAYVAHRAERYKREKTLTAAQNAQGYLGQPVTMPVQRWYDLRFLDDPTGEVDKAAEALGATYAAELEAKRTAYVEATA